LRRELGETLANAETPASGDCRDTGVKERQNNTLSIISERETKSSETFNTALAIEAQADYARMHRLPNFTSHDGRCFACGQNIYTKISVEQAGSKLISGCPHCHRSFCD
jgi:hypothetical protein